MSKLLLDENPLLIMPNLACKIGLNESIVLQQVHYWIKINEKAKTNLKDGCHWTYNSYNEWQKQFPFWSIRTIQRIIKSLEDKKLLIVGNYNKLKIDNTKWYRIDYEMLENLEKMPQGQNDDTKECSYGQNDDTNRSTCHHEQVNLTTPIPETTSKTTTKITNIAWNESPEIREGTPNGDTKSLPYHSFLLEDIKKYDTKYRRDIIEFILYYNSLYLEHEGKEHYRYGKSMLKEIYSRLDTIFSIGIQDERYNRMQNDIELDTLKELAEKHFNTKYSKKISWTLLTFLNDKIMVNRYYELYGAI